MTIHTAPAGRRFSNWRKTLLGLVLLLIVLSVWGGRQVMRPQPPLPTVTIRVGTQSLQVELATTAAQRERGLMFREALGEGRGMLFVYEHDQHLAFWMHNTRIPLSVAFLNADGRVLNIADMRPEDDTIHRSAAPARYALEVNQGWFTRQGITVCEKVKIPRLPLTTNTSDESENSQ
jgi:uncharacterized protein